MLTPSQSGLARDPRESNTHGKDDPRNSDHNRCLDYSQTRMGHWEAMGGTGASQVQRRKEAQIAERKGSGSRGTAGAGKARPRTEDGSHCHQRQEGFRSVLL